MGRSRRAGTLVLGLCLMMVMPVPATARPTMVDGPRDRLTATLDGRPIAVRSVGGLRCHDAAWPQIRCFGSSDAVARDFAARSAGPSDAGSRPVALRYVRIFEHAAYDGASMYLSQAYADLGDIGWNDRISSFKVVNGGSGSFFEHADMKGAVYPFSTNVASLGSWNDLFSSVEGSA